MFLLIFNHLRFAATVTAVARSGPLSPLGYLCAWTAVVDTELWEFTLASFDQVDNFALTLNSLTVLLLFSQFRWTVGMKSRYTSSIFYQIIYEKMFVCINNV